MLTIVPEQPRYPRREMLRIGGLALGGLSLPGWLATRAAAAAPSRLITGKSVVFLFMHGGPSQIETFDPKMTASSDVHSATGELATSLPGVTFGGTFPRLATMAHKLSVVRSFVTGDGNHDLKPIVGRDTSGANLGSLYSAVAGANHARTGMPTNAALFPQAVDPTTGPAIKSFGQFEATGALGAGYAPFVPGAGGDLQNDMELHLSPDRLGDRRSLLAELDRVRFAFEGDGSGRGLNQLREQAFSTIAGGVAGAFDLSRENPAVVARYDTAPLVRPDQISRRWNNYNHYVDNAKSLGKLLLLARRLCEAGCGFVTVTTSFVWDMHADENNAGVEEGMRYMGVPFDYAVSAFLEDVAQRGLSDDILLVCCGEMGRTPRINARGGRDHWGGLAPLLLAGGGLKMGQVVGQSTRDAGESLADPVRIGNLVSTVLRTLIDVSELRVTRGVPREIVAAASAEPIPRLEG
ncbi:MAG TPA: DUF1501 domain-containing protein [Pirellulales bacterium]|jgi:hypothetical protein|nr:DUF1501 domain-containing protein [Pirellulales bacterium]